MKKLWFSILLFTASLTTSLAHDPFEVTTYARLRSDGFTMDVTMAQNTAQLLNQKIIAEGKSLDGNFEEIREPVGKNAATFFVVTSNGKELKPIRVEVSKSIENDVLLHYVYPPVEEGAFRIAAPFLQKLPPDGYGTTVTMLGVKGMFLGQKTLMLDDANFDLASIPKEPATPAGAPAATPATTPSPAK